MKKLSIKEAQKLKFQSLLLKVDKICKKENICYYLAYGTLLGAVREKGFIPWDEDIDIWMKKKDMDKFLEVYNKYEDDKFFLQTYDTDKYYVSEPIRLCINGTSAYDPNRPSKQHDGAYIDIFLLDEIDSWSRLEFYVQKYLYIFMTYKKIKIKSINKTRNKIIGCMLKCIPISVIKKIMKLLIKRQEKENGNYFRSWCMVYGIDKAIYEKEWFSEIIYLDFEGHKLPCPSGYDEILKKIYGNYMVPHSVSERRIAGSTYIL